MATSSAVSSARVPLQARRRTEDLLCRVGAYRPARNAYQALFNRSHWSTRRRDRDFFRRFVGPASLVFDVGANEGRMTETFAELGATVIALEPNPALAARVRRRYGSSRVTVEATAVGAEEGTAVLRLGRDSGHSTLSDEWQETVGEAATERWESSIEVPVTTLDSLIARHGTPEFVKIDVEGFEPQVLAGLHHPIQALSFEFLSAAPAISEECLATLGRLGAYELNLALGERHEFHNETWMSADALLRELHGLSRSDPESYGDVYARLAHP